MARTKQTSRKHGKQPVPSGSSTPSVTTSSRERQRELEKEKRAEFLQRQEAKDLDYQLSESEVSEVESSEQSPSKKTKKSGLVPKHPVPTQQQLFPELIHDEHDELAAFQNASCFMGKSRDEESGDRLQLTAMYKVCIRLDTDMFETPEHQRPVDQKHLDKLVKSLQKQQRFVQEEPLYLQVQDTALDAETVENFRSMFIVRSKNHWLNDKTIPVVIPRVKLNVLNGQHRIKAAVAACINLWRFEGIEAKKKCPVYWTALIFRADTTAEKLACLKQNIPLPKKADSAASIYSNFLSLLLGTDPSNLAHAKAEFWSNNDLGMIKTDNKKKFDNAFEKLTSDAQKALAVYLSHPVTSDSWNLGTWYKLPHIDAECQEFIFKAAAYSASQNSDLGKEEYEKAVNESFQSAKKLGGDVKRNDIYQDPSRSPSHFIYYAAITRYINAVWLMDCFCHIQSHRRFLLQKDTSSAMASEVSNSPWMSLTFEEKREVILAACSTELLSTEFPSSPLFREVCEWWSHQPTQAKPTLPAFLRTSAFSSFQKSGVLTATKLEMNLDTLYPLLSRLRDALVERFPNNAGVTHERRQRPVGTADRLVETQEEVQEHARHEVFAPQPEEQEAVEDILTAERISVQSADEVIQSATKYLPTALEPRDAFGFLEEMETNGVFGDIPQFITMDLPYFNTNADSSWNRIEEQTTFQPVLAKAGLQNDPVLNDDRQLAFCIAILKSIQHYVQSMETKFSKELRKGPVNLVVLIFQTNRLCEMILYHLNRFFPDGFFVSHGSVVHISKVSRNDHSQNDKWVNRTEEFIVLKHGNKILGRDSLRQANVFNMPGYHEVFDCILFDKHTAKKFFQYAKPISLMRRLLSMYSSKDDVVWDLFGGSGSTSIAACLEQRFSIYVDCNTWSHTAFQQKRLPLEDPEKVAQMYRECVFEQPSASSKLLQGVPISRAQVPTSRFIISEAEASGGDEEEEEDSDVSNISNLIADSDLDEVEPPSEAPETPTRARKSRSIIQESDISSASVSNTLTSPALGKRQRKKVVSQPAAGKAVKKSRGESSRGRGKSTQITSIDFN